METTLFEVTFYDGRKFNIFCHGKNQIQRFRNFVSINQNEIESVFDIASGIHTITEFEKITTNKI